MATKPCPWCSAPMKGFHTCPGMAQFLDRDMYSGYDPSQEISLGDMTRQIEESMELEEFRLDEYE